VRSFFILYSLDPLLCNEREMDIPGPFLVNGSVNTFPQQKTRTKHSKAVFSMWYVPRCYKQGTRLKLSSVWESVKRRLEPEAEE
jgi:hypothetical protein